MVETSLDVELEADRVTNSSLSHEYGLALRVLRDGRLGFAYTTASGLDRTLAGRALAVAGLSAQLPMGFAQRAPRGGTPWSYHRSIESVTPEDALSGARALVDSVKGVDDALTLVGGGLSFGNVRFCLHSSEGAHVEGRGSGSSVGVSCVSGGDNPRSAGCHRLRVGADLPLEETATTAAKAVVAQKDARSLPSGLPASLEVVLTPQALGGLMPYTIGPALLGEQAARKESIYADRVGKRVAPQHVQLIDDGTLAAGLASGPVDDEGSKSVRRDLVRDGILRGFVYDRLSAARWGATSTGNGVRGDFRSPPSTGLRTLVLRSSEGWSPQEMVQQMRRGVVVHDIMGGHTANRTTTDFSVTTSQLFYVERGEVRFPISQAMVAGNLGTALRSIRAVGTDHAIIGTGSCGKLPSVLLKGLRVAG